MRAFFFLRVSPSNLDEYPNVMLAAE